MLSQRSTVYAATDVQSDGRMRAIPMTGYAAKVWSDEGECGFLVYLDGAALLGTEGQQALGRQDGPLPGSRQQKAPVKDKTDFKVLVHEEADETVQVDIVNHFDAWRQTPEEVQQALRNWKASVVRARRLRGEMQYEAQNLEKDTEEGGSAGQAGHVE